MFKNFIHFIKYNNFIVLIMLAVFALGSGVFAQSNTGQELIGEKHTGVVGTDNKLLLEADLDTLDMDYRIERIDEDKKYYYVTYTFLDLVEDNQAWQYQIQEKIRKVSKRSRVNLPKYLAEEFTQMHDTRINYLRKEQTSAQMVGIEKRVATVEYSGLIGASLDVVASMLSDFNAVKTKELPSPTIPASILPRRKIASVGDEVASPATVDSITNVYSDYIKRKDPDHDDVFGVLDNCPDVYNPKQIDTDDDGVGDACTDVIDNGESVIDDKGVDDAAADGDEVDDVVTGIDETIMKNDVGDTPDIGVDGESGDATANAESPHLVNDNSDNGAGGDEVVDAIVNTQVQDDNKNTQDDEEDANNNNDGNHRADILPSPEDTTDKTDVSSEILKKDGTESSAEVVTDEETTDSKPESKAIEDDKDLDVVIMELN